MRNQLLIAALLVLAAAPVATAAPTAPPEPACIQVYRELTSPPVAVTLVNGCTVEVEVTTGGGACMERYVEHDLGPVYVQSRDTCHYLVRASADLTVGTGGPAVEPPPCYYVYREYHVGPVTVIQRSSCSVPEVRFDGAQTLALSAGPPPCYDVYREYEAGPVTVIQRDSCSAEVYLFGEPLLQ